MCNQCKRYMGGCNRPQRACCKKDNTKNISDLPEAPVCGGAMVVEYENSTYQLDFATCVQQLIDGSSGGGITGDSLSVTGGATIGGNTQVSGNLNVDGNTTLDNTVIDGTLTTTGLATFNGGADFSGNVDFTGANLTFDNGELCDEVSRCVMNDASVTSAIEAVASGVSSGFGCSDVASCITSNAAVQTALTNFVTNIIQTGSFTTTGDRTFNGDTDFNGAVNFDDATTSGVGGGTGGSVSGILTKSGNVPNGGGNISVPSCGGSAPLAVQVVTYTSGQGGTVSSTSTRTSAGTSGVYFQEDGSSPDPRTTTNIIHVDNAQSSTSAIGTMNAAGTSISIAGGNDVESTYIMTVYC